MSGSLDHVLLTRFNLPSDSIEGLVRAQDGWLTKRVTLFERYCLPSFRAQSAKNCRWIIYFDPESPQWLINWMRGVNRPAVFQPIFRSSVSRAELISDIKGIVPSPGAELLTTNLDNDDGLSVDFAARLQAAVCPPGRSAIYLTQGLIKEGDSLFTRKDPLNAFCSVRESWEDPITCWADWHTDLRRHMPVVSLTGDPAWLQVVHGTNVSNRVRGRRVSPTRFHRMFPGLLDNMPAPTRLHLVQDAVIGQTRRFLLELGRGAVKHTALTVLGRSGPDRVKQAWRRLPHLRFRHTKI